MIAYRLKTDLLFYAPESQFDANYVELAEKRGYEFYRTQRVDPKTTELDESQYVMRDCDTGKLYYTKNGSKYLFAPEVIRQLAGSNLETAMMMVPDSHFEQLFEPVGELEIQTARPEPQPEITDEQFRRMAIRASLFMETGGCRSAADKHNATNVSGDRGGLTKYGITEKAYPNLDIKNLTYDDAVAIYEKDYWPTAHADELPRPLNGLTYDLNVTSGPKNAIRILQRAVGATDDGLWGPRTKQAAWDACSTTPKMLAAVRLFTEKRIAYYQAIVANDSTQQKFLNGWINRAVRSQNFMQALLNTLDIL